LCLFLLERIILKNEGLCVAHEKIVPKQGGFSMSRVDDKYLRLLRERYRRASKKEKSMILDEFVKTTGYGRKYAIALLNGKRNYVKHPVRRPRSTMYDPGLIPSLLLLFDLFDGICSKRLRAAMKVELPKLYEAGFIQVDPRIYRKLMDISPSSIDRLLAGRRSQLRKSRRFTKPGTLLKHQIPIRTWADWTEDRPGFCKMDLVDHSGGLVVRGADHAWTLCFTDVKTAWTECVAVQNKAQVHVLAAICRTRERLPFPLLGIDSDNGSEFINDHLRRYCITEKITFTRGRAGKKNDSAYVEQKNWSVVRRAVGYCRYDTSEQLDLLNRLYAVMHFYVNFFLPVMKLDQKVRIGSKIKKTYDDPLTPYARILACPDVSEEHKAQLRETYHMLNLVNLRQQIDQLQDQLLNTVPPL
jgi:hypothetical protein